MEMIEISPNHKDYLKGREERKGKLSEIIPVV